ncbi:hypothetical protein [Mesorhizobium sp.]|uniref:hypothetical protein n=1 Tax=Mesorhizobium sp. TaxID=1871066 RepID=UPI00257A7DAD|nr:hypothetical protein [Mesorhizobium sp.]
MDFDTALICATDLPPRWLSYQFLYTEDLVLRLTSLPTGPQPPISNARDWP